MLGLISAEQRFADNQGLVGSVLHKYFKSFAYDEDMYQIASIGLWKACQLYDSEHGAAFSTYAFFIMKNEILQEIRRRKRTAVCLVHLDQLITEDGSGTFQDIIPDDCDCIDDCELRMAIINVMNSLNSYERSVIDLKLSGKSQSEIGRRLGKSQPQVSRTLKKVVNKIIL